MEYIVGVRFRPSGKIYNFLASNKDLPIGEKVLVETTQGLELGQVAAKPREAAEGETEQHKRIIRVATKEDLAKAKQNEEKAARALRICREKVAKHGLEIRPVSAEYTFDGNKLTIYFTAEGRVDFRALVRDLVSVLKCRIELRQIGVRDEAALLGGLGPCGRMLCCSTFLTEFKPVSIRMAKEQNLSLNPSKISGLCGRLMCCLRYESDGAGAGAGVGKAAEKEDGVLVAGGEEGESDYPGSGGCCAARGGCTGCSLSLPYADR